MEATTGRSEVDRRSGVVLAGGHSQRFGNVDKALATLDGTPMLRRIVDRLGAVVEDIVVSCRVDQRSSFESALEGTNCGVSYVHDPGPDSGPLVGLREALRVVSTPYTAVVACDMPRLDPAFLDYLFVRAAGHDGAVPRLRNGRLQPIQAVYRVGAMRDASDATLEARKRSLSEAVSRLDTVQLSPNKVTAHTSWSSLTHINTPTELDRLKRGSEYERRG